MGELRAEAEQWLSAARAGSPEALGQALEACRGYLLTVAQRELDPALQAKGGASDLVQNTLVDALRDFSHFQGDTEAELLYWLRRLLINNLTDFSRQYKETDKRNLEREISLDADSSTAKRGGGLAADDTSPSGQALAHEQAEAIQKILHRLPDDYQKVITLRYQEERSFEEIGQLLNLTPNAARKLLLRAVEKVRHELDESS
jgi:RNA polymerase sigma-70 factor (ECF subfamily)